jgi:transposase
VGEQTVRDSRPLFLLKPLASRTSQRPPGRPSQWTQAQRRALANVIKAGPQAAGYPAGCGNTPMIHAFIQSRFGGSSHPHSVATWLHHLGFSSQKARLVSEPLHEAQRLAWRQREWPRILRLARPRKALLLCGEEASLAQWGSLSSPWAPQGQQPAGPTRGKRKGYKVCGLIDYCSGRFFSQAHAGRFNSESSATFWLDVLSQTHQQVGGIQDGARSPTSKAMQQFFDAHAGRLTIEPLPAYAPDCNPIEPLWKQIKKEATHLQHCPECTDFQAEVAKALLHFAQTPDEITVLMARYGETLGKMAA